MCLLTILRCSLESCQIAVMIRLKQDLQLHTEEARQLRATRIDRNNQAWLSPSGHFACCSRGRLQYLTLPVRNDIPREQLFELVYFDYTKI